MKRIISLITAAALALGTTTAFAQDNGEPPGNETVTVTVEPKYSPGATYSDGVLKYRELKDGTYEVSGVTDETAAEITIPAEVNGKKVTSISHHVFSQCSRLTSVTIPDSVTSIEYAFAEECSTLESINVDSENLNFCSVDGVLFNKSKTELLRYPIGKKCTDYTIPDGVTSIGYYALHDCSALTSVHIPNGVTNIETRAFSGCVGLKEITIPNSVTDIGSYAFEECTFTSVIIPNSVTNIDVGAFSSCSKLATVSLPDSITSIERNAFAHCSGLTEVTIPNSVTDIKENAFYGCGKLASINIPDSVKSIGKMAFYECSGLVSITIPDSVTSIGSRAFEQCGKVTAVTIPGSVTSIGANAFAFCRALTAITVEDDNRNYSSENGVLFNKAKTKLMQYPVGNKSASYVIPSGVTDIDSEAFAACGTLTSIKIPDTVVNIGTYAFAYCSALTEIDIPSSVMSIGIEVFHLCSELTAINVDADNSEYSSVDGVLFNKSKTDLIRYPVGKKMTSYTVPDGVTTVYDRAFYSVEKLTAVTIPISVTIIGNSVFSWKLKDIYYVGTKEQWDEMGKGYISGPTIHYNSTGPVGVDVTVDIKAPEGTDISGQTATTTVNGETKPLTITDGKLDLSGIPDGEYTFTFTAKNCAPRDYKVTVSGGAATGLEDGVELHLYGDINGDGKINTTDILKAKLQTKGSNKLDGYDLAVADANKDGKVNGTDVLKLKLHAKGSTKLW